MMMRFIGHLQAVSVLLLCVIVILSCKEEIQKPEIIEMPQIKELVHDESMESFFSRADEMKKLTTLVLDTPVTCADLEALSNSDMASNLEYLLFYNLDCNAFPPSFAKLYKLEKLIINSSTLDHFPEVLTQLPQLKQVQLETMDYNTYEGKVSGQCRIEEIEFQTTPIKSLGNLENITTLRRVGVLNDESLNIENENIQVLRD